MCAIVLVTALSAQLQNSTPIGVKHIVGELSHMAVAIVLPRLAYDCSMGGYAGINLRAHPGCEYESGMGLVFEA